jgi:hypothetical protein
LPASSASAGSMPSRKTTPVFFGGPGPSRTISTCELFSARSGLVFRDLMPSRASLLGRPILFFLFAAAMFSSRPGPVFSAFPLLWVILMICCDRSEALVMLSAL